LNTERQVLWLSYDDCREKEVGEANYREIEKEYNITQLRCTEKTQYKQMHKNLNIQNLTVTKTS
jgi:hypothetical protein